MSPKLLPGVLLGRRGLLKGSWSGLGGLLESYLTALGPNKKSLERLLAAPRGIVRPGIDFPGPQEGKPAAAGTPSEA